MSEELSLHVRNFMFVTTDMASDEMYIDKLEEQQPLEIDESSDDEINETDDDDFCSSKQNKKKLPRQPKMSVSKEKCKSCGKEFQKIIMHLSKSKSCKAKYGVEELEEMKNNMYEERKACENIDFTLTRRQSNGV